MLHGNWSRCERKSSTQMKFKQQTSKSFLDEILSFHIALPFKDKRPRLLQVTPFKNCLVPLGVLCFLTNLFAVLAIRLETIQKSLREKQTYVNGLNENILELYPEFNIEKEIDETNMVSIQAGLPLVLLPFVCQK